MKTCDACLARIARQDCHRNRHGEYICRSCQAAGVKVVNRSRILRGSRGIWRQLTWALAGTVLAILVVAVLILFSHET